MRTFEIPPYPVLSTPYLLQFSERVLREIQRKYAIEEARIVAVPLPSSQTPSTSPSTSCTYSNPASPEKKECPTIGASQPKLRNESATNCQCSICGKKFSRQWLLQGHLRTHTGEKPFKCEICDKHFADKSNLRAHIQTHSGKKPFCCLRCGKRFALKSYLSKHEESKCTRRYNRIF